MKRCLLVILIGAFSLLSAKSQDINQNAPYLKWKQLKTDNYTVIFPEELLYEAQRVANTLEYIRTPLTKTLDVDMPRWKLMLSNQGAQANGYVGLAPRRSEWYSAPPQGSLVGTSEWYNMLAVHEGRHMVQYDKFNHGLTKLASIFLGQTAVNALSMFSVPIWFWEGDAVGTETALTSSGRGRVPDFDLHVRALLLNDIRFSYYKAYMLSYKDYYPNWYTLGYLMNAYVRRHNPPDTWGKIHKRTSWFSISPFRFSRMMRIYTGLNARQTYNAAMKELDSIYRWQINGLDFTKAEVITKRDNELWFSYNNPHYYKDGSLIATISGMAEDIHIVKINPQTGTYKKLLQAPIYEKIHLSGEYICWNEYQYDKRYMNQNYSNLVLYNIETDEIRYLTEKGRFFVPEVSPDLSQIVAVEFTTDRKCNLVFFDFKTGEIIKRIPEKNNEFIQTPSWSENGSKIVYTRQLFNGKAVTIMDVSTGESYDLIEHTYENIANPTFYKNYIIYESPYSGVDNLYAIDIESRQRFQITNHKYCSADASPSDDGTKMLFIDYDIHGYDIAEMPLNPSDWRKIEDVEVRETRYFEPMIAQEQGVNIFNGNDSIPKVEYPVTNYNQCAHSLNFHSWTIMPLIKEATISLSSKDLLNTTALNLNAGYNLNEKTFNTGFNLSYTRYYPVFSLSGEIANRATKIDSSATDLWNERNLTFAVDIPWFQNKGAWQRYAVLSIKSGLTNASKRDFTDSFSAFNGNLIPLHLGLLLSNSKSSAQRDLDTRLSQRVDIKYSSSVFSTDLQGSIFSVNSTFNFPGLMKHHVLTVEAIHEQRMHETYWFASNVAFTRGYDAIGLNNFTRFLVNYRYPLLYPDLALGALAYLKRVRGAVFYDHGFGDGQTFRSAGFDVEFDFHLLNLPFELNAGFRVPYLIDKKEWGFNVLFLGMEL